MRQFSVSVASDGSAVNKKMNTPATNNNVALCFLTIFKTIFTCQLGAPLCGAVRWETMVASVWKPRDVCCIRTIVIVNPVTKTTTGSVGFSQDGHLTR